VRDICDSAFTYFIYAIKKCNKGGVDVDIEKGASRMIPSSYYVKTTKIYSGCGCAFFPLNETLCLLQYLFQSLISEENWYCLLAKPEKIALKNCLKAL